MGIFDRNDEFVGKDVRASGSLIRTPGVYDATIVRVSTDKSTNGATQIDFTFKFDKPDIEQTIYGLYIEKADGSPIQFTLNKWNDLLLILGVSKIGDPVRTKLVVHAKGGGNEEKELNVFPVLAGRRVKVGLSVEYYRLNGEIREKVSIDKFFRNTDGASADEIKNQTTVGKQLEITTKYLSKPKYKDDLTEVLVAEWLAEKGYSNNSAKALLNSEIAKTVEASKERENGKKFAKAKKAKEVDEDEEFEVEETDEIPF